MKFRRSSSEGTDKTHGALNIHVPGGCWKAGDASAHQTERPTQPWTRAANQAKPGPGCLPGAACVRLHLNSVAITKDTPENSPPYFKLLKMRPIGY